jgi:hypothetical protein
MKAKIEVDNRHEAAAIRSGLDDPAVRASVIVMGSLNALPSDRARKRVLQYVIDYFDENPGQQTGENRS